MAANMASDSSVVGVLRGNAGTSLSESRSRTSGHEEGRSTLDSVHENEKESISIPTPSPPRDSPLRRKGKTKSGNSNSNNSNSKNNGSENGGEQQEQPSGSGLLDAIVSKNSREQEENEDETDDKIDDPLKMGRSTPSPVRMEKVGELPHKAAKSSRNRDSNPLPPRSPYATPKGTPARYEGKGTKSNETSPTNSNTTGETDSHNGNGSKDGFIPNLSNYRHLSKEERRRLLNEVKMVLGEESLLSGANNSRRDKYDDVSYAYDDDDDHGEGESLLQSSEESRTAATLDYTQDGDTAFYTEDRTCYTEDLTMCTADASAFMSQEGTLYSFDEEDTREDYNYRREERGGDGGNRRTRSSRARDVEMEMEESDDEDDNFFSFTDACMSYLCDGDRAKNEEIRRAKRERKMRRQGRNDTDWNKDGRRDRRQQRLDEDNETATFDDTLMTEDDGRTLSTAGTKESYTWSSKKLDGMTVKERLAKLEKELIGKEKDHVDDEANAEDPPQLPLSPSKFEEQQQKRKEGAADNANGKQGQEEDAANNDSFWKDESRASRRNSKGSKASGKTTAINTTMATMDGDTEVTAPVAMSKAPSFKITLSFRDRSMVGKEMGGSPAFTSESKNLIDEEPLVEQQEQVRNKLTLSSADGKEENETIQSITTNREAVVDRNNESKSRKTPSPSSSNNIFSKARSLTKERSRSPFVRAKSSTNKDRSVSPFVRAISSLSRNNSRQDKASQQHQLRDDLTMCSIKTEAFPEAATVDSGSIKTAEESLNTAKSAKSNRSGSITRTNNKVWREYTDPTTGNKYYSNGKITMWERPANADVVTPSSIKQKTKPSSSDTDEQGSRTESPVTPVLSNASNKNNFPGVNTPSKTPIASNRSVSTPRGRKVSTPRGRSVSALAMGMSRKQQQQSVEAQPSSMVGANNFRGKKFKLFSRYKKKSNAVVESSPQAQTEKSMKNDQVDPASPDRTVGSATDVEEAGATVSHTPLASIITHDNADYNTTTTAAITSITKQKNAGVSDSSNLVTPSPKPRKKKKKGWREYTEPSTGKKYYSDGVTTTWAKPENFTWTSSTAPTNATATKATTVNASSTAPVTTPSRNGKTVVEAKSVLKISEHSARTQKVQNSKTRRKKSGWREYTEPSSGKKYYSDGVTTTWERPANFAE